MPNSANPPLLKPYSSFGSVQILFVTSQASWPETIMGCRALTFPKLDQPVAGRSATALLQLAGGKGGATPRDSPHE
jgi:hypothetical protein